ncbi:methanogen output domain 1-containing protein [Aquipuribacter sp. MA13-6]|uniref:methanogen output domain 1-containing protein n=1 Tax=unclassified Aquipuribacter TaxID=2635084 RepID=UPI003EE8A856
MDWYLNTADAAALWALRQEVRAYLRRHAEPGTDTGDADLVVEELVGNAVRHAGGPVWVSLSWRELSPTMRVLDLGPGFDPSLLGEVSAAPVARPPQHVPESLEDVDPLLLAESGRGLFLVSHLAESLQAHTRDAGGMSVQAVLPVKKRFALSHDPPRQTVGALPLAEESAPDGTFGKESFLRALVVQLARTVEFQHGPDAAEAAVAQVGADVGGRMEEEFRRAEQVVDRLSPQQVGDCYVRLKHAIDGGFRLEHADEDVVVLTNDRCPFGDVVTAAPSLCRMTSSVFGGIAARSSPTGTAAVLLEERIAIGDPGCRVTVYLGEPPPAVLPLVHAYRATRV